MNESELTALQAGFILCHDCRKLVKNPKLSSNETAICPRCGSTLHSRKPQAIARTWAFVITAAIFFIPANILPIMKMDYLGRTSYSTIMDGILYFFKEGSYGIGSIIFIASIMVPLFKLAGLTIILLSIQFKWHRWLKHKSIMFTFISFVGRWSMLDIFVIVLMQSLLQFGSFSSTYIASAANYFTLVVLATMLAAITFDSRLIWDLPSGQVKPQQK